MQDWRLTRLRGGFALTFDQEGKRRRFSLDTDDPREAQRLAPALYAELTRPKGRTVADLWKSELVGTDAPIDTEEVVWRAMISKAMEG